MKNLVLSLILILLSCQITLTAKTYNTDDAKKWEWQSETNQYNQFKNVWHTSGITTTYVNLVGGIVQKNDGIKWTFSVTEHGHTAGSNFCFGIEPVSELGLRPTLAQTAFLIGVCSKGATYQHHGSSVNVIKPMTTLDRDFMDTKWDVILEPTKLIVTNEDYFGGDTRIEWDLDVSLDYFPLYHTTVDYYTTITNTCNHRCDTCPDFKYDECSSCTATSNIDATPSCKCKTGWTDMYDQKLNLVCVGDTTNFNTPKQRDWEWSYGTTLIQPQQDKIPHDGLFENYYKSTAMYTYVDMPEGMQLLDDGFRWHVEIKEESETISGYVCFGVSNVESLGLKQSHAYHNMYCTDGNVHIKNSIRTRKTNQELMYGQLKRGNIFEITFVPGDSYLTVSNVRHGGHIHIEMDLDKSISYYPIIRYHASNNQNWKLQLNLCVPRCQDCKFLQPYSCTGCQDSGNRGSAPNCKCNIGKQDEFRQPNIHRVQELCIDDYVIHDLKPPEFQWYSETTVQNINNYDKYSTNTSRYFNIKGKLGVNGLVVQDDGVRWQMRVTEHENYFVCFGVQKTERQYLYRNSWQADQSLMCGLCTDGTFRDTDCVKKYQRGNLIQKAQLGIGQTYDLTYNYGMLIISNERSGGSLRYEYILNENLNYIPNIYMYNTNTGYMQNTIQLKTCSLRCDSCSDWLPESCITCSDPDNRTPAPFCRCKTGFEDEYDNKQYPTCRQKLVWNEPSPPEWVWNHEKSLKFEEIDNEEGTYYADGTAVSTMWLDDKAKLTDQTKWTVKIHNYFKGSLCFGIMSYEATKSYANPMTSYHNYGVSVCTDSNNHYNHHAVRRDITGIMPGVGQEANNQYDLYYQLEKLVITNEAYGGEFRSEWTLYREKYYTPYITKYSAGGTGPLQSMVFQIKGCHYKCESCEDWNPRVCLQCENSENRQAAPGCICKENFEDYYDHRNQKVCRPIPNRYKPAPPDWIWETKSTHFREDIENENNGYFYNYSGSSNYGNMLLREKNILEDQTEWEIKVLEHHTSGHLCIGVIELQRTYAFNWDTTNYSYSSTFCTDNTYFNYEGIAAGVNSKTFKYGDMPNHTRTILSGSTFKLKFDRDFLNISNVEDRGTANLDLQLKPYLNYTPFIYWQYENIIQVKGCSHRCQFCVDYKPTQCTICNDHFHRQAAPGCKCKDGYYDTYDHKFNEICLPNPTYTEFAFPEWTWYTESIYSHLEDPLLRGIYTVKGSHSSYFVKGFPILEDMTKWTVNILNHMTTTSSFMCFGVMKAEELGVRSYQTSDYSYSTSYCTTHTTYVVGTKGGAAGKRIYQNFYHPIKNIKGSVDIIYKKGLLIISTEAYGGEVNVEFDLIENMGYSPYIHLYDNSAGDLNDQVMQFQECNLNCQTCVKWQPQECTSCKGASRLIPPNCNCAPGYTDFYKNQYNTDCIKEPNTSIGEDWKWTTQSSTIDENLDGTFDFYKAGQGYLYVDLGRDGIPTIPEGIKWSVKLTHLEHNTLNFCVGIMRVEQLDTTIQNPDADSYTYSTVACASRSVYKYASKSFKTHEAWQTPNSGNVGMTFDIVFRENYLSVSSLAYGGTAFTEWELVPGQKYVPVINLYNPYTQYKLAFSLKPCAYQCTDCDSSVSKDHCTSCKDGLQRTAAPECACNYGLYDDGSPVCQICQFPCKSCTTATYCSTCVSQPNRLNNPPFCSCYEKFYQASNYECLPCSYVCGACKEIETNCTQCKTEIGRKQDPLDCSCLDGYFEDISSQSCLKCPLQCSTCNTGNGSCIECVSSQIMVDGVCGCATTGFSFEGGCESCINPCLECDDYTSCKTCRYPTAFRAEAPSCECQLGYYEDESYRCLECMSGCAQCQQYANNCLKCIEDPNRSQDPTNCQCAEGYFEDPDTNICKLNVCPEKCQDCVPGSSVLCLNCAAGPYNRDGITNNCECSDGFFEMDQIACVGCNDECGSCADTSGCLTCASAYNRGSAPLCKCNVGFYENGTGNCEQCNYKCASCDSDPTVCGQCANDPNRHQTGTCECKSGFTEDPSQQKCVLSNPCDVKCGNCEDNDYSACTSCPLGNNNRLTVDDNCDCVDGYYDDLENVECKKCESPCANCSDIGVCITCSITGENRSGAPDCACLANFTEDFDTSCISNIGCKKEIGRQQYGDCHCLDGYYNDSNTNSCPECVNKCDTCSDLSTCLTCSFGYQSSSAPACNICDRKCGDCGESITDCTVCNVNRDTIPSCTCSAGFFDDGSSRDCKKCNKKCGECHSSSSNCIVCASTGIGRNAAPGCSCKSGFFEEDGICAQCDAKCISCTGSSDNCQICNFGKERTLLTPSCGCKVGFFETHFSNNCETCSTDCVTRDNETGLYQTADGGEYSFGDPELNGAKQEYETGEGNAEPNVIPDDYVDDGEGNLVPPSFFEELKIRREMEAAQKLIEQQKADQAAKEALLAEQAAELEIIKQQQAAKEAELQAVKAEQAAKLAAQVALEAEIAAAKAESDAAEQENIDKQAEIDAKEAENIAKAAEIAAAEAENVAKAAEIVAKEAEIAAAETAKTAKLAEIATQEAAKAQAIADGNTVAQAAAEAQLTTLVAEKVAIVETITEAETVVTVSTATIATNETAITTNETAITTNETTIATNETTIATNEITLVDNATAVAAKETEVAEIETEIVEQDAVIAVQEEEIAVIDAEVATIEEVVQETQAEVETIQEEIQEKEEEVEQLEEQADSGDSGNSGDNGNGTDNGNGVEKASSASFSVTIVSGNAQSSNCEDGCIECNENDTSVCFTCDTGMHRLNNPPHCSCEMGFYANTGSSDCLACPEDCLACQGPNFCTKCPLDSNRQIDTLTGLCTCQPGFADSRHGLQCQRCFYYQDQCYQQCPKNTELDENSFNCIEVTQELSDITLTVYMLGLAAFLVQVAVFAFFVKCAQRKMGKDYGLITPGQRIQNIYRGDEDAKEDDVSEEDEHSSNEKLDANVLEIQGEKQGSDENNLERAVTPLNEEKIQIGSKQF